MEKEKKIELLKTAIFKELQKSPYFLQNMDDQNFYTLKNNSIELLLAISPSSKVEIHNEFLTLIKFTKTAKIEYNEEQINQAIVENKQLPEELEKEVFAFYKIRFVNPNIAEIFKKNGMMPVTVELYEFYDNWQDAFFYLKREYEFYVDGLDTTYELLQDSLGFVDYMGSEKAKSKDVERISSKK